MDQELTAPTCLGFDNCSCTRCKNRRKKQYRLDRARGHRRLTDAAKAREHLAYLHQHGVGRRTIAAHLGLSEVQLFRIYTGRTKEVRTETEALILGFTVEASFSVRNAGLVDSTATRLRCQGLIALGYTQEYISRATGRSQIALDIGERVQRQRALAILELCEQIGDTPGPSRKAALQARRRGWRLPADYDEELFYAPDWDGTEPDTMSVECRSIAYLVEYDWLHASGVAIEEIARRLNPPITVGYLQTLLSRRARGISPFGRASEDESQEIA